MNNPAVLPSLVPAPTSWRPAPGTLDLAGLRRIVADPGSSELLAAVREGSLRLRAALSLSLPVQVAGAGGVSPGSLALRQVAAMSPEQYRLRITSRGGELSAAGPAGFRHGITTLIQLGLDGRVGREPAVLPCGVIDDRPRFGWRGMLLDCGRHFMPVDTVKEVLDRLALYKFNVLHWHLTEDQGWRLEIPGYPRLTEIGAWRTEIDGTVRGGFYTAGDVREVLAYAAERSITVVPEIEMPGHSLAALAAYPELSCTGGPFAVETQWGVHRDVFCPGREATFAFLEDILTYVMELFPGRYIHIGADEVPRDRWRECEHCQVRIRNEHLAGEDELQSWFIGRIGEFLTSHGRRLIGWDEILADDLPGDPDAVTIQAWRGLDHAAAAAEAGHDVIVSPTSHAYFDYDPGVLDLQQVFDFRPVPRGLDETAARHILGGQMNLWTEYIPPELIDRMLFPRLAAMSEALWTGTDQRDFAAFLDRLRGQGPVWDHLGVQAGPAARPVVITGLGDPGRTGHRLKITLDPRVADALAERSLAVRYHLLESPLPSSFHPGLLPEDQGLPPVTTTDPVAPGTLEIPWPPASGTSGLVQAQLFSDGRPYGAPALLEITASAAVAADIDLVHGPAARYPGGGPGGLVDGLRGSRFFQDGRWAGIEGEDLDAVIDLGEPQDLRSVSVRFLQDVNAWILLPRQVRFRVSPDQEHWREAGTVSHRVPDKRQDKLIHEFAVDLDGRPVRFVQVQGISPGVCPDWHPGRGRPCWLFLDEIVCRGD